jgi:hypothetical protein
LRPCFFGINGKSDNAEDADEFDEVEELEKDRWPLANEEIESFLS